MCFSAYGHYVLDRHFTSDMTNMASEYLLLLLFSTRRDPRGLPIQARANTATGLLNTISPLLVLKQKKNSFSVCYPLRTTLSAQNDISQIPDCPSTRPLPRVGRNAEHMPRSEFGRALLLTPHSNAGNSGIQYASYSDFTLLS